MPTQDKAVAAISPGDTVEITLSGQYSRRMMGSSWINTRRHLYAGFKLVVRGSAGEHSDRLLCVDGEGLVYAIPQSVLRKVTA